MNRKSRSRLAADWFAKLRINLQTQEVEHEDVAAGSSSADLSSEIAVNIGTDKPTAIVAGIEAGGLALELTLSDAFSNYVMFSSSAGDMNSLVVGSQYSATVGGVTADIVIQAVQSSYIIIDGDFRTLFGDYYSIPQPVVMSFGSTFYILDKPVSEIFGVDAFAADTSIDLFIDGETVGATTQTDPSKLKIGTEVVVGTIIEANNASLSLNNQDTITSTKGKFVSNAPIYSPPIADASYKGLIEAGYTLVNSATSVSDTLNTSSTTSINVSLAGVSEDDYIILYRGINSFNTSDAIFFKVKDRNNFVNEIDRSTLSQTIELSNNILNAVGFNLNSSYDGDTLTVSVGTYRGVFIQNNAFATTSNSNALARIEHFRKEI